MGRGRQRRTGNVLVCKDKRDRAKVFQSLPVCVEYRRRLRAVVHPWKEEDRDEFPIPSMNYGAVKQDTGTFFQVLGEPSHQATQPLPTPNLWLLKLWSGLRKNLHGVRFHCPEHPRPLPTFLLRAGSKGKQIGPGKGSEPAWRSPQGLSWSSSASLEIP